MQGKTSAWLYPVTKEATHSFWPLSQAVLIFLITVSHFCYLATMLKIILPISQALTALCGWGTLATHESYAQMLIGSLRLFGVSASALGHEHLPP